MGTTVRSVDRTQVAACEHGDAGKQLRRPEGLYGCQRIDRRPAERRRSTARSRAAQVALPCTTSQFLVSMMLCPDVSTRGCNSLRLMNSDTMDARCARELLRRAGRGTFVSG